MNTRIRLGCLDIEYADSSKSFFIRDLPGGDLPGAPRHLRVDALSSGPRQSTCLHLAILALALAFTLPAAAQESEISNAQMIEALEKKKSSLLEKVGQIEQEIHRLRQGSPPAAPTPLPAPVWLRPSKDQKMRDDACPVRVEFPINAIVEDERKIDQNLHMYKCHGSFVGQVIVKRRSSKRESFLYLHVAATAWLPEGQDKLIDVRYSLVQGGRSLGRGREVMKADEGENNWADGAVFRFPKKGLTEEPLMLRMEAAFRDR